MSARIHLLELPDGPHAQPPFRVRTWPDGFAAVVGSTGVSVEMNLRWNDLPPELGRASDVRQAIADHLNGSAA